MLNYHDIHLLKSTRKDTVVEVVLDLYKKNLLKKPIGMSILFSSSAHFILLGSIIIMILIYSVQADTVQGPLAEHEAGLLMATVMTIEDDDDLFVVDDSFGKLPPPGDEDRYSQ